MKIIAILLALCAMDAFAVQRYYDSVNGNDANSGLSPSLAKQSAPTSTQFNAASCGDQFLLARGSIWTGYESGNISHNQNCAADPVVIDAYTPSSGATALPFLSVTGAGAFGLRFGNYNNTSDDRGYTIRNLELFGNAVNAEDGYVAEYGVLLFGTIRDVLIENVVACNFRIGIFIYPRDDSTPAPSIERVTIRNSEVCNNYSMGVLGAASDYVIEGTLFEGNNYSGSGLNHAIYVNSPLWNLQRLTFRNNRLINNSVAAPWSPSYAGPNICTGGNITAHGNITQLTAERNLIQQVASSPGCYGLSLTSAYPSSETFAHVIFRANRIANLLSAIVYDSAPSLLIENNVIVDLTSGAGNGYVFYSGNDEAQSSVIARNNSFYVRTSPALNTAPEGSPTNQVVANNLIVFWGTTGTRQCFTDLALSAYAMHNYNLCRSQSRWSNTYSTLANAQAAGFDLNSLTSDPLVTVPSEANGWNMVPSTGSSPLIGAGNNASCARLTVTGRVRTGNCTIGAFQYGLDP